MDAERDTGGGSAFVKSLFVLVSALTLAALGYAAWIVVSYWDRVGV